MRFLSLASLTLDCQWVKPRLVLLALVIVPSCRYRRAVKAVTPRPLSRFFEEGLRSVGIHLILELVGYALSYV